MRSGRQAFHFSPWLSHDYGLPPEHHHSGIVCDEKFEGEECYAGGAMTNAQRKALEAVCVAFLAARVQGLADEDIYQWIKNRTSSLQSYPDGTHDGYEGSALVTADESALKGFKKLKPGK